MTSPALSFGRRAVAIVAALGLALTGCATTQDAPTSQPDDDAWAGHIERASMLFEAGEQHDALVEGRRAVEAAERAYGDEDVRLVKPILVYASMLVQAGQIDEAARLSSRANTISEATLVEARSRVATTLKYLGTINMLQQDYDAAEATYVRAVEISEAAVGPDHTETAKHLGNLAGVAIAMEDFDRARSLLDRAMTIWSQQPAPDPVYTVGAMTKLALVRFEEGRDDDALKLYADGLAIQERAFGSDSWRLANLMRNYVAALRRAGDDERADELERRLDALE